MATTARNRRLEPSHKQHGVVDDLSGVVLDVEVTTGEVNEGHAILERLDATAATTGAPIGTVTADAGHAYAKVFAGLEARENAGIIPTKAEPIRSKVPLRRFRYDAKHDQVKCPRGKVLRPNKARIDHGRFFASQARDCKGSDLASICLSPSRATKALVIVNDHPPCSGSDAAANAGARRTNASTGATLAIRGIDRNRSAVGKRRRRGRS
jgi:hypothetical protein